MAQKNGITTVLHTKETSGHVATSQEEAVAFPERLTLL